MKKSHVFVLAVLIAGGATLGTFALTRTTELGVQARATSTKDVGAVVATRTRQLDAMEISLRKALAKKPPRLPALPKLEAPPPQPAPRVYASSPVAAAAPAPVTVTRAAAPAPAAGQATAHEREHESSGGELDD